MQISIFLTNTHPYTNGLFVCFIMIAWHGNGEKKSVREGEESVKTGKLQQLPENLLLLLPPVNVIIIINLPNSDT